MIIIPANTLSTGAYEVANSCRFDGSSAYMTKTPGSAGSQVTQTYSVWVKRSKLGDEEFIMYARKDADDDTRLYFENDTLRFQCTVNNTTHTRLWTNRVFRDPSAWYHIVISYDSSVSTPSTSSVQMFINGVKETSFSATIYPSQNEVSYWCDDALHTIGRRSDGTSNYYNGYMAEAVLIDGSALTASSFGEFNEDSPQIWQPKDVSGLTFGTNGFYLDFEASDNLGNDANGGTDFSESGLAAADQATDSPTNNFCTLNTLVPTTGFTFSEGNCKMVSGGSDTKGGGIGTFGLTAGKWWWEIKMASLLGNHTHGIISELTTELYNTAGGAGALQNDTGVTQFRNDDGGEMNTDGTQTTADYGTFDDGDIMGIAFNADDNQISIYDNGSAIVSDFTISTTRGVIFPFFGSGINTTFEINFGGCSAFAISSAANDANGHGVFEHAPPSGYLALCSKNLGSDGG